MQAAYTRKSEAREVLFTAVDEKFRRLKERVASPDTLGMGHSDVERLIEAEGREVWRELFQAHVDLRVRAEPESTIVGSDEVERTHRRLDSPRVLGTVFGDVVVARTSFGGRGVRSVCPVDADLNLPTDKYSLEVRRRSSVAAARTSFDAAVETLAQTTGAGIAKRQVEELVQRAARDFDDYYAGTEVDAAPGATGDVLVISCDGKGVVMRTEDLLEATREAALKSKPKLATRRSKGEKPNRKRMATVAAVYTIAPYVRSPEDILAALRHKQPSPDSGMRAPRPRPTAKRVWASLQRPMEDVIDDAFAEAQSRDPEHKKRWVVLVDGDAKQIRRIKKVAARRKVAITIVVDFIHALEYLWRATLVFNKEGTPESEAWVHERLLRLLAGPPKLVAGAIRRSATKRAMPTNERAAADKCANYLTKLASFMHYDEYLSAGLPIASGVIEGACRHLICDRMDITGARWSLDGAEAILRLRSLLSSGDFDEYWRFHEEKEQGRNHASRYRDGKVPKLRRPELRNHLRVVK